MRYYSYSDFLKEYFGEKIYKISLNAGFSCPNRDGTISTGGCIFCSEGGSGDFAANRYLSITDQINAGKIQTAAKFKNGRYIAYFQAFTNTYAPVDVLRARYQEALTHPDIAAISIATRPDCLSLEILDLLCECLTHKPVFVELGLQTIHDKTAQLINRGYHTPVFDQAVYALKERGIRVTAHMILGLPGETKEMQLATIDHINALPVDGIKLSMLHILQSTPLADYYNLHPFPVFTMDEYTDFIVTCIRRLRPDICIERMTGDGPKRLLIAPDWSGNKRLVLNTIHKKLSETDSRQGTDYRQGENPDGYN